MPKPITPLLTVDAVILFQQNSIVLIRRKNPPFKGELALPGGFVDIGETIETACIREAYEETGLNISGLENNLVYDNDQDPYYVKTDPGENRQNITLNYVFLYDFGPGGHYAMLDAEKFTSDEVDSVEWVNVKDLNNYTWAFEHQYRIGHVLDYLSNN